MVNEMTDVSTSRNHKEKTWTKEKEENTLENVKAHKQIMEEETV